LRGLQLSEKHNHKEQLIMKHFSNVFFACLLAVILAGVALAQGAKKPAGKATAKAVKFMGMGDGISTCPVTGEEIHNKDVHADFHGRTVYFCCAGCMAKAQKNPAMYIKKTAAAQKNAVAAKPKAEGQGHDHAAMNHDKADETKFVGKGDGIETCPVTGEPINKNLKGEALGREFYVCCEGCMDTVKKNPAAYLKPLPKKETAFLGKGDGVDTCPVTGEPVDKKLSAEANGQKFAVCCAGCIDTVKANPAAYLKPAKK
jgi:YHS domain-containing protein